MPLTYDGDPTPPGGQDSPSVDPAFGATPTINLPISGEGGVATLYQPLKTLADWVAFLAANGAATDGSRSLKKLLIDAALASPASVPDGVLQVDGDATGHTYEELVKFPLQGSSMFRRTFRSSAGIHHTTNAKWVVITGVGHWRADDGAQGGTFISESATGINVEFFTGPAPGSGDYSWTSRGKADASGWTSTALIASTAVTAGTNLQGGHLIGNTSTPTATADVGQAAAPDNSKITVEGDDLCGTVTVQAQAGAIAGLVGTVLWTRAYTSKVKVTLWPANAAAADLATQPWTADNGPAHTGFNITTSATALTSGTTYAWHYHATAIKP